MPSEGESPIKRRTRYALLTLLLLILVATALLWPMGRQVLSLTRHLRNVQKAVGAGPSTLITPENRELLASELAAADADLSALQRQLSPVLGLTQHLGWVPRAGDTLKALPDMLDLAQHLTSAAATATEALPAFDALMASPASDKDSQASTPQRLLEAITAAQPQIMAAGEQIEEAMAARERISDVELLPSLASQFQRLDAYLPLLSAGVRGLQLLPQILGADGPRTYLLIAQNSDELRATGGFISGIGVLTINRGEMAELSFQDSYAVENWTQPHPDPPPALRKYMLADLWTTRDANWWPDYPTSAKAIEELYALNQGSSADGVIAVDMQALELVVAAIEPLVLQESGERITAANLREKIYEFWAPPPMEGPLPTDWRDWPPEVKAWWARRKDFMPTLSSAILGRMEDPSSIDLSKLIHALQRGLAEKHILLYFNDPSEEQLLKENGWDAAISAEKGDYLLVVDSNVGFNKANANIAQRVSYRVDLSNEDVPQAEVVILYHHQSKAQVEECDKEARYEPTYQALTDRCYWDYVRLYVPKGSTLLSITGADDHDAVGGENGKNVFSAYFVLAPGKQRQITFRYLLPDSVFALATSSHYVLHAQKQPGTKAVPLRVHITLPPSARVLRADPEPAKQEQDAIEYATRLRVDRRFEVVLEPPN